MTTVDAPMLIWPPEAAREPTPDDPSLYHPGTNVCLDFHGDPLAAKLVVFSDGNHHMALGGCAGAFLTANPDVIDVFYATTPPHLLVAALRRGVLYIGNLAVSIVPDVFIGPPETLDQLVAARMMKSHRVFSKSRGNVLLVRQGNPKRVEGIADLMRNDICIALSNPVSEKASFQVYFDTLVGLAAEAGLDVPALEKRLTEGADNHVVFSSAIHHREVPQMLVDDRADVAVIYYHLALRYCRIFPDMFDIVPLGGTKDDPQPDPAQVITRYHMGLIGDGGKWGRRFFDFMSGETAAEIYRNHGLVRAR